MQSSAVSVLPSGIRTPVQSLRKWKATSSSKISSTASRFRKLRTSRLVSRSALSSIGVRPHVVQTSSLQWSSRTRAARSQSCRRVAKLASCFRWKRSFRSSRVLTLMLVTLLRVCRWKARRPRILPVVCHALRNCSKLVVRRTMPSSQRSMVLSASVAITRTSAVSSSSQTTIRSSLLSI
ncbi:hypothetical protein D3C80_969150 [compost metagenome]